MAAAARHTWGPHATRALIRAVARSEALPCLMASTTAPNAAAWVAVVQAMGAAGRGRTIQQVRAKWKAVKAAFHLERAHRRETGNPSDNPPHHYRRILRLWVKAGRPTFRDRRYTTAMRAATPGQQRRRRRRRPRPLEAVEGEEQQQEQQQDQPSTSGGAPHHQPSPASVEEVGGGEDTMQPATPPPGEEEARSSPAGSPPPPTPVQGVGEEEEETSPPLLATPPPGEEEEDEPWLHRASSPQVPTLAERRPAEEPWQPVVRYPLPPGNVEYWEVVGEPGPGGPDHRVCQEAIQRLRAELETTRGLLHLEGQQLQREQGKVASLLHVIRRQQQALRQQGDLLLEQHKFEAHQQQVIRNLMGQQPPHN